MYEDYKVKPLHIMLPQTNMHVKCYERQTKWMYFSTEEITYRKPMILFGTKSAQIIINKNNL